MPMTGIEQTIVGLDVGTTKVCAVVGEMRRDGQVNVLGMGVGPTRGLSKGVVVNIGEVVSSITARSAAPTWAWLARTSPR